MTIDDQEQVTGFGKMFESCLAIFVLIKVEKVTSFIELDKGTGDGHTGSRHSFDVPALGLCRSGFARRIESHRLPIRTETCAQQEIDS